MNFDNIPHELRAYRQFVCWRYEDRQSIKPTKVPYSALTGELASVTNAHTWASFEEAVQSAAGYDGIGFVLTDNDPFSFIDLDDTEGDAGMLLRQQEIFQDFHSYAERSPSGNGLHIIVRGTVPSGKRRNKVEIYSSLRYMTMTGDVFRAAPIEDCQAQLYSLWASMDNGSPAAAMYAGTAEQKETDEVVVTRAMHAQNGQKFAALYEGRWEEYYPSQSEADFALVDIVSFYTQCRSQIERIFRKSALGQRAKANRQDYLNYMVNKSFDRMTPPVDHEGLLNQIQGAVEKSIREKELENIVPLAERIDFVAPVSPAEETAVLNPECDVYQLPPGLVGDIAKFIYAQAPKPVAEIALAGALGLMSGIVGRSYNVSGTGLNQYILLLAKTGVGKEAMASGIDKLMNAIRKEVPNVFEFIGPSEISSPQALLKYISKYSSSFVSITGEFGIHLQQMTAANASTHMVGLRRMMLDLYNKSGEGQSVKSSIFADVEKNTTGALSPAYSLLGESTPTRFYEGLNEGLISEGLLPRFIIIEYSGFRVPTNEDRVNVVPSEKLLNGLRELCATSLAANKSNRATNVQFSAEAAAIFKQFDKLCDEKINSNKGDVQDQLWNRANLKALKLAATVAIGINIYNPVITSDEANWALRIVKKDIETMTERFKLGEIGKQVINQETMQLDKLKEICKRYIVSPFEEIKGYVTASQKNLYDAKVIPHGYVHKSLCQVAIFRKDNIGATNAIKRAIKTLIDSGDLQELSKMDMSKRFKSSSVAYMIANPASFEI